MTAYRGAVASSFLLNNDLVRMRSIRAQLASVCRGGVRTLLQSAPADGRQADELQRQLDELRGRLALCEAKQGAGPDHYDRVRWDMPVAPPPPLSQITQARRRALRFPQHSPWVVLRFKRAAGANVFSMPAWWVTPCFHWTTDVKM